MDVAKSTNRAAIVAWSGYVSAAVFPVLVSGLFLDWRIALPQNIGWLQRGDGAPYYLGWAYFRESPWSWPLGANPNYGLELGDSILNSDSTPLLAMLFKLFAPWLPQPFQYAGVWIFACIALLGISAYHLLDHFVKRPLYNSLAATLVAISPPMFFRFELLHLSLIPHFLIVVALAFYFRNVSRPNFAWWPLLLATSVAINPYIFLMVAAIWFASVLVRSSWLRYWNGSIISEVATSILGVLLTAWTVGYFLFSEPSSSSGFGRYRLNLLSLIDSNGFSLLFPDIASAPGEHEGFAFPGAGVLVLLTLGLILSISKRKSLWMLAKRNSALAGIMLGLTLFAISNNVGIGSRNVLVPLPGILVDLADTFRSSGRFFWPVLYLLILVGILVVQNSLSRTLSSVLVACLLVLQVGDLNQAWHQNARIAKTNVSSSWSPDLRGVLWSKIAENYDLSRGILPANRFPDYGVIGLFSVQNGMPTDIVSVSRIGELSLEKLRQNAEHQVKAGIYENDTVYFVRPEQIPDIQETLDRSTDVLIETQDLTVLLPGWASCDECMEASDGLSELGELTYK